MGNALKRNQSELCALHRVQSKNGGRRPHRRLGTQSLALHDPGPATAPVSGPTFQEPGSTEEKALAFLNLCFLQPLLCAVRECLSGLSVL